MTDAAQALRNEIAGEKPEPPQWYDRAIEHERRHQEFVQQREAAQQAEKQAAEAPKTLPDLIRQMMSKAADDTADTGSPVAPVGLNSDALLRLVVDRVGGSPS